MTNHIFLSVIMPIYNGEKYLAQAIESVLNQECKDLELILVNDGSTDNSEAICRKYEIADQRIKYYKKENSGVSDTRNFGINKAQGEYIAFLDCDDVFCKNFYTHKFHNELKNSKVDIASLGFIWGDGKIENGILNTTVIDANYNNRFSVSHMVFCSFVYNRDLFKILSFNKNIAYSEDYDFLLRALGNCNSIKYFDEFILVYRDNKNSVTHTRDSKESKIILKRLLSVWPGLLEYFQNTDLPNSDQAIDYCQKKIVEISSTYISESIISNVSIEQICDELSKYVKKEDLRVFENKYPNTTINEYLNDFNNFYVRYRKQNRIRIYFTKLGLNKIGILRKILLSPKYNTNISEYVYPYAK